MIAGQLEGEGVLADMHENSTLYARMFTSEEHACCSSSALAIS